MAKRRSSAASRTPGTARQRRRMVRVRRVAKPLPSSWDFTKVATDFIEQSSEDVNTWSALLSTGAVAHYARKVLTAKAKRDPVFAKRIALMALMGSPKPSLALPSPAPATPKTPSVVEESVNESPVRKVRRRLRFKQAYDDKLELMAESALGSLSLDLAVLVFSFLDLRSKVCACLAASQGLREVLHQRGAWDPLVIEKSACRGLLRRLKHKDPLGYFTEERVRARKSFPRGFFEVSTLMIELMDPERVESVQSDTEDEAPRPFMTLIPDPLDEMVKRLKHYFTRVCDLTLRNIEDYRMDYRFVEMRCNDLCSFPYVLLCHGVDGQPQTYCLRAKRHAAPAGLPLTTAAALSLNSARIPATVDIKETSINEREALFLQEHLSAFKNGSDFCLSHSIYRYVPSHTVRKKYKAVVDSLRQRFPGRFHTEHLSTPTR